MKGISIIILLLILAAMNFLLRKVLYRLKSRSKLIQQALRYLPMIELMFWSAVIIWASNTFFKGSSLHLYVNFILVTLGLGFFSWFFMKDLISGIQIKMRFSLSPGQRFKAKKIKGTIKSAGFLLLELKTDNGSELKIPFAQIDQKSIELNFQEKSGGESVVHVQLDEKLNEEDTIQKIMELTMNSPWSSYKSTPQVSVLDIEDGLKTYKISCNTNSENGGKKLRELIEQEIELKKKGAAGRMKKG